MKRHVLQLQADVYISHLYRSCNYDEKIIGSPMKVGGGSAPPPVSKLGGQLPPLPLPGSCVPDVIPVLGGGG